MGIDHPRFWRVTERSMTLVERDDVIPIVRTVYNDKLAPHATRYKAAHEALEDAEKARAKEKDEALVALAKIDQPYKEARTALNNYIDDLAVPKSLKSRKTAVDKLAAITRVHELIERNKEAHQWARDLAAGAFGRLAPEVIREVQEWIHSHGDYEKAVRERAAAYEAAYPAFLGFRKQVEASYGDNSVHYRNLVVRSSGKLEVDDVDDDEEEETDDTEVVVSTDVTPTDVTPPAPAA